MKNLAKSVGVLSAAVAFGAGSALAAPAAGAQSLPTGSLGDSLGGDTCGEQVVTPETLANSGWGAPEDENAAEIAAVEGAPEEVGTAALTFEDGPENGTSLYKDAERMPLDELLEDGAPVPMSYQYTSDGQAPALQIRLNNASVPETEDGAGFATIVWSPADGDGTWREADPADSDQFWATRDIEDADGETVLPRGERTTLEEIVGMNPDAVVTEYGVQKTRDNTTEGVAIDDFTFGCETTDFELDADEEDGGPLGSLTDIFSS